MKLNSYLALGLMAVAATVAATSCDSKNDPTYKPAAPSGSNCVYFAQADIEQIVDANANSFTVNLYRSPDALSGELTVPVTVTCAEEGVLGTLLTPTTTATFADGSPNAQLTVSYDAADLVENEEYTLTFTIDPEFASQYALTQTDVTAVKSYYGEWEPFMAGTAADRDGLGVYTFTQYYTGAEDPVRVMCRTNLNDENLMQFNFEWLLDNEDPTKGWGTFLTANSTDGGKTLTVPEQQFTVNPTYGKVYVCDAITYTGDDAEGASSFDPETGLFSLNLVYYVSLGEFGWGYEYCQLNGFEDNNDYSLKVTDNGIVTFDNTDYQVIGFYLGEAITWVDYTLVEGTLEDDEIQEVAETLMDPYQEDLEVNSLEKSGNVTLTFPESGTYTIVAVGYTDAGMAKAVSHVTFTFDKPAAQFSASFHRASKTPLRNLRPR